MLDNVDSMTATLNKFIKADTAWISRLAVSFMCLRVVSNRLGGFGFSDVCTQLYDNLLVKFALYVEIWPALCYHVIKSVFCSC